MRLTADPAHANFRPSSLNGIANQMHVTAELRKGARAGETVLCRGKGGHVILELDSHPSDPASYSLGLLWPPGFIWLHAVSDAVIGLTCLGIPPVLLWLRSEEH